MPRSGKFKPFYVQKRIHSKKRDVGENSSNECTVLRFSVDKRSVRDHMGILVNKHKRKVRAEEKASGIAPDEPSEMENLLDTIIALEESSEAESQELLSLIHI